MVQQLKKIIITLLSGLGDSLPVFFIPRLGGRKSGNRNVLRLDKNESESAARLGKRKLEDCQGEKLVRYRNAEGRMKEKKPEI